MYWLAVSHLLLSMVMGQAGLTPAEQTEWQKISPSIVMLFRGGSPVGAAALISPTGYFIAAEDTVLGSPIQGKASDGRSVELKVQATDQRTHLVLLQARDWQPERAKPLSVPVPGGPRNGTLFLVFPNGPVRGILISARRSGVNVQTKQYFALNEVRYESQASSGSALAIHDRQIVGSVGILLQNPDRRVRVFGNSVSRGGGRAGVGGGGGGIDGNAGGLDTLNQAASSGLALNNQIPGPARMEVGFVTGPTIMKRVIEGFLSPSHRVLHPYLGANCLNWNGAGALVHDVVKGSAAEAAGLMPGDIIFRIGRTNIRDQFDFGETMLRQSVGAEIQIMVRRNSMELPLQAVVGSESLDNDSSNVFLNSRKIVTPLRRPHR